MKLSVYGVVLALSFCLVSFNRVVFSCFQFKLSEK